MLREYFTSSWTTSIITRISKITLRILTSSKANSRVFYLNNVATHFAHFASFECISHFQHFPSPTSRLTSKQQEFLKMNRRMPHGWNEQAVTKRLYHGTVEFVVSGPIFKTLQKVNSGETASAPVLKRSF